MQIAQCIFTGAQDQPSLEFISMCILNLPPIRWSPKSFNHLKAKLQFMVWAPGASGSTWAPWSFLLCDVTICANSHNNCGLCRKFMFFGKNGNCHWMFLLFSLQVSIPLIVYVPLMVYKWKMITCAFPFQHAEKLIMLISSQMIRYHKKIQFNLYSTMVWNLWLIVFRFWWGGTCQK